MAQQDRLKLSYLVFPSLREWASALAGFSIEDRDGETWYWELQPPPSSLPNGSARLTDAMDQAIEDCVREDRLGEDLWAQLLVYCRHDTLAMVEAHRALMRLTVQKQD